MQDGRPEESADILALHTSAVVILCSASQVSLIAAVWRAVNLVSKKQQTYAPGEPLKGGGTLAAWTGSGALCRVLQVREKRMVAGEEHTLRC
jgi:hypothetical protein